MSAEPHAPHAPHEAPQAVASTITIRFPGPGAAGADVAAHNVTEGQFYEAAFLIDTMAREVRAGQAMRAAQRRPGLAIPTPDEIAQAVAEALHRPLAGP